MNIANKKRLAKDVVDIIKHPLNDNNIYYKHDDDNMLSGYALIIGPEDTIYNYGYYFFKFNFKEDYPYKPPFVEYLTNEHGIRFHPNLYRNGKVCLSLLNTWNGEQWTSCQTIRTILLNLVTLFNNKPLLHEPGITEKYKYFNQYNEIIKYSNYNTSIISVLNKKIIPNLYEIFKDIILENYQKNRINILKNIEILKNDKKNNKTLEISLYGRLSCKINYDIIFENFKKINN